MVIFLSIVTIVAIQRLWEIKLSQKHERQILAQGGQEHSPGHYKAMVIMHTSWFISMLAEVYFLHRQFDTSLFIISLIATLIGNVLRGVSMYTLGNRWTVRIFTLPHAAPISSGIYAYLKHPIYVGVALEIAAIPLLHSAYLTSIFFTIANLILMKVRIPAEERALRMLSIFVFISSTLACNSSFNPSQFYQNSKGSPLISLIQSANHSIDMEIYEMDNAKVIAALEAAIARGVVVRIIQEPLPLNTKCAIFTLKSTRDTASCLLQKHLVDVVRASGGIYEPFNKDNLCGIKGESCFQHGKIILIDGQTALINTGNFNSSNLCDLDENPQMCHLDYAYLTQNPSVVTSLKHLFELDLVGEPFNLSLGLNDQLTVSPMSQDAIIQFLESATERIQIENQYLNDPQINLALATASRHGIKVESTVSSVCAFAPPNDFKAASIKRTFEYFDSAGISSRLFTKRTLINGKPGYLHSKAIVVDRKRAWLGSINGSTQSLTRNREYGIFFDDIASVQHLSEVMTANHYDAGNESWQESLNCHENI